MTLAAQLRHHYLAETDLPYDVESAPTSDKIIFVDGSNVLSSLSGSLERRPGFTQQSSTTFPAGYTVRRVFAWRRFASDFFLMVCATSSTNSRVYKQKLGTDTTFILLYDDVASNEPFDFSTANNLVFFGNGNVMWKWDGSTAAADPWGIGTTNMSRGISGATNASPIVITTTSNHDMATGDKVFISGVGGNTAANGNFTITNVTATTFSLDGSTGNGTYTSGGAVYLISTSTAAGTLDATVGYKYVYTFGNPNTGHQSNPSPPSASTGALTNLNVTVKGFKSVDNQVTRVHVYRSTDGGGGVFFELPNSPVTVTAGAGTWTLVDSASDTNLQSTKAPAALIPVATTTVEIPGMNDPPEMKGSAGIRGKQPVWFANRIWFFLKNELWYSGWEEIVDPGVEEECFPTENFFAFSSEITALASVEKALLIFTAWDVWRIEGDALENFSVTKAFSRIGVRERAAVASFGGAAAWLDTADVVRISDGFRQQEISFPIRGDLQGINHANSSLAFYSDGRRHWLLLSNGTETWVYDLDREQWMPPWSIGARALGSGETAAGTIDLFYGIGDKLHKMTSSTYTDDGAAYTAFIKTGLFPVVPGREAGKIGFLEYLSLERNSIAFGDVQVLTDEDPTTGTFTSINSTKVNVPNRTQGTNVVEEWFYTNRGPSARRISLRVDWAAASTNFKLYSIDVAFKEVA